MMDSCSKMEIGCWKDARKATCRFLMRVASFTNKLGNPSANVLQHNEQNMSGEAPRPACCRNLLQLRCDSRPFDFAQLDAGAGSSDLFGQDLLIWVIEKQALLLQVVRQRFQVNVRRSNADVAFGHGNLDPRSRGAVGVASHARVVVAKPAGRKRCQD